MSQSVATYDRSDEIRSLEQNKCFHALIGDIAKQVEWAGAFMSEEDWKRLFLGAAHGQHPVPNPLDPHGPFVIVNKRRSSGLVVPEMSDLIAGIEAFGAERGVKWSHDE